MSITPSADDVARGTPRDLYEAIQTGTDPFLPGVIARALAANDLPVAASEQLQDAALSTVLRLVEPQSSMMTWSTPRGSSTRLTSSNVRSRIDVAVWRMAVRLGTTSSGALTAKTDASRDESAVIDPSGHADSDTSGLGFLELLPIVLQLPPDRAAVLLLVARGYELADIGRRGVNGSGQPVTRERIRQIRNAAIEGVNAVVDTGSAATWGKNIYRCPTEIRILPVGTLPIARRLFEKFADAMVAHLGISPSSPAEEPLVGGRARYFVRWEVAADGRRQALASLAEAINQVRANMGGQGSKIRVSYLGARLDIPALSNPSSARRGRQATMHYPWL